MLIRKVCMIGDFGVGKTSLVARFVHSTFSDSYLSTVGVKIDTRTVDLDPETRVKLVIWDIAGADAFSSVDRHYLQGAAGFVLVADGTRARTVDTAIKLANEARAIVGPRPSVLLINKYDIVSEWEVEPSSSMRGRDVNLCSARLGTGVDTAFAQLAGAMSPGSRG